MAGGEVLGIGIGGAAGYTIAEIPAYIEEAFESSLEAVKVEIAEKCGVKPKKWRRIYNIYFVCKERNI